MQQNNFLLNLLLCAVVQNTYDVKAVVFSSPAIGGDCLCSLTIG